MEPTAITETFELRVEVEAEGRRVEPTNTEEDEQNGSD